jgi:hypothetical protein
VIHCGQCGLDLPLEFADIPRLPCPSCGATSRQYRVTANPGRFLVVGADVAMTHRRPGILSTAEETDTGSITLHATGPSPTNEAGSWETCERFVRALNGRGASWSRPTRGEKDVDCHSETCDGAKLLMQVIRASSDEQFWKEMNTAGSVTVHSSATGMADEMIAGVSKKSAKYPSDQRRNMILLLDAARTPSHTFQRVLDVFRTQHGDTCRAAGFAEVWVVGPSDILVERLDYLPKDA